MFTPTKQQLEELGLHEVKSTDLYLYKVFCDWWNRLYFNTKTKKWDLDWKVLYPQSIDDIKTLIRMLTPTNN